MVDTVRTLSTLQTVLADNASGDIDPQDLRDMMVSIYGIDFKPTAVDPPDDEFDDTTGMSGVVNGLDAKWTVTAGATGTVDLLETGDVSKYDTATRDGWILFQVGSDGSSEVELRQDYTLPDGNSIILAIALSALFDDVDGGGLANNDHTIGLYLNSDDAAPDTDTTAGGVRLELESDINALEIGFVVKNTSSANQESSESIIAPVGGMVYLRIARSGNEYFGFYSTTGASWVSMSSASPSVTALSNVWIRVANLAAMGDPVPIHAVDWIRLGTNTIDPW